MDLYLIRHTRAAVEPGVCYGRLDVPLREPYEPLFGKIRSRLPSIGVVCSSPLARCRLLGEHIAAECEAELIIDAAWCELDFGQWEGQRWDDIDRTQSEQWSSNYWDCAPPAGETYAQLYERVTAALHALTTKEATRVAIVTHAGPIRALLSHCLGLARDRYHLQALEYGSVTHLTHDTGSWSVESLDG